MAKSSIETIVKTFVKLRHKRAEIEKELDALKPIIEARLGKKPDETEEIAGYLLKLVHTTYKRFDQKAALEKLGEAKLAPFFTESHSKSIRVD